MDKKHQARRTRKKRDGEDDKFSYQVSKPIDEGSANEMAKSIAKQGGDVAIYRIITPRYKNGAYVVYRGVEKDDVRYEHCGGSKVRKIGAKEMLRRHKEGEALLIQKGFREIRKLIRIYGGRSGK